MAVVRGLLRVMLRGLFRFQVCGDRTLVTEPGRRRIYLVCHASHLDPLIGLALFGTGALHVLPPDTAAKWYVRWMLAAGLAVAAPAGLGQALALRRLAAKRAVLVVYPPDRSVLDEAGQRTLEAVGLAAERTGADVAAVRLCGAERTHATLRRPHEINRRLLPRLTAHIDSPVRFDRGTPRGRARRVAAGRALYFALSEFRFRTSDTEQTLFAALREAGSRYGTHHPALTDSNGAAFTYRTLSIAALVLGRALRPHARPGEALGVLLPNAAGTAVTFFALQATGRVPAMLNYTAGAANILAACRAAEVRTVLSSRTFIERAQLQALTAALGTTMKIVWLEDLRGGIGRLQKLRGLIDHVVWRPRAKAGERAAILFTSGSEGSPKGVVLSHRNILDNCAQVACRIDFGPEDKLLSVLPVFHSLGLTAGMILPLVAGVKLHFYPSPLHYKQVPEQLAACRATIFFATDTFLAGYARNAAPDAFRTVRLIVSGAEPVRMDTRRTYRERFGLQLLEGFGMTEMAPVVAVNTPMFNRDGTVGPLLPCIETRLEPVPGLEGGGQLWLRGPNMMLGYLNADRPGQIQPPPGGWHDSGDVVDIDADGYVTIRGRVKRFAKIAGEMISLTAVEAMICELWPEDSHAVVSVPDPRRGERVVLLTTRIAAQRGDVAAFGRSKGVSELMVPSEVIIIDQVPLLGSGKTDHVAARRLACDRMSA
ncbi:AMP-binding protein [Blastochloris sulfoviridis]|uniref:AMP-binding protein n=1 Tax=Blastochloris sulfoviridis TaxID=50712 RepID=A0A5M6HVE1_9HYPH|nr:AMP-binding protein [Blastochloris sulfoviridis]KAA5599856.1 AMP-binding protein [Blastochloris sulfoviridis]